MEALDPASLESYFCQEKLWQLAHDTASSDYFRAEVGEVCRIHILTHLAAVEMGQPIGPLPDDMNVLDNFNNETGCWTPSGTQMVCPTIDGKSSRKLRYFTGRSDDMIPRPPLHFKWLVYMYELMNELARQNSVELLRPPFVTNSNEIYAESEPPFYVIRTDIESDHSESPPPQLGDLLPS